MKISAVQVALFQAPLVPLLLILACKRALIDGLGRKGLISKPAD